MSGTKREVPSVSRTAPDLKHKHTEWGFRGRTQTPAGARCRRRQIVVSWKYVRNLPPTKYNIKHKSIPQLQIFFENLIVKYTDVSGIQPLYLPWYIWLHIWLYVWLYIYIYERSERQNSDYFIELFNHDKFVSYGKLSLPHSSGDNRVILFKYIYKITRVLCTPS